MKKVSSILVVDFNYVGVVVVLEKLDGVTSYMYTNWSVSIYIAAFNWLYTKFEKEMKDVLNLLSKTNYRYLYKYKSFH